MPLPSTGSVLGVDIGFSPTRRSGAACRLSWSNGELLWEIERFRYAEPERTLVIKRVVQDHDLLAAAFDGPLRGDLAIIGIYRRAERLLTSRLQRFIGKPGQANAPIGKRLNSATNEAATIVLSHCSLALSAHAPAIHEKAIVEAFPSAFLGLLLAEPADLARGREGKSDRFFEALVATGALDALIGRWLPMRNHRAIGSITNHDDRAAFVCALSALAVAALDFTAVGDQNGYIILPPADVIAPWALPHLHANAAENEGGGLVFIGG